MTAQNEVVNPEDQFSRVAAHDSLPKCIKSVILSVIRAWNALSLLMSLERPDLLRTFSKPQESSLHYGDYVY